MDSGAKGQQTTNPHGLCSRHCAAKCIWSSTNKEITEMCMHSSVIKGFSLEPLTTAPSSAYCWVK